MAAEITAAELYAAATAGALPQVLDLRNPDEAAAAPLELPGDTPVVPVPLWHLLDDPAGWAAKVPAGAVLVCAKGNGSAMVADELAGHGTPTVSLTDGLHAWNELLVCRPLPLPAATPVRAWQFLRPAKGCLSYLIGVPGERCVVVDPARQPAPYLQLAAAHGMQVAHIMDTHLHADHVSGGPLLAERTGAPYALPEADSGPVPWPTEQLRDGQRLPLGAGALACTMALHLPGHTPGTTAVGVPGVLLAAGDTVFVRGVGRPDLTGQAEDLARALFSSVRERLRQLPPDTMLLPAHWSTTAEIGSDGSVRTTLGEVLAGDLLAGLDEQAFVAQVLASLPSPPASYDRMRAINAGAAAEPDEIEVLEVGRNQCAAASTVTAGNVR